VRAPAKHVVFLVPVVDPPPSVLLAPSFAFRSLVLAYVCDLCYVVALVVRAAAPWMYSSVYIWVHIEWFFVSAHA
jgi:hypothetical protein